MTNDQTECLARVERGEELAEKLLTYRSITESGCWEWMRSRTPFGYGRVAWRGRTHRVHRLSAHLWLGFDPKQSELFVLHKCDNPPCFNPEHLWIGSLADNNADMMRKGREGGKAKSQRFCPKGHEKTGSNAFTRKGDRGIYCRICCNEVQRAGRLRRKQTITDIKKELGV